MSGTTDDIDEPEVPAPVLTGQEAQSGVLLMGRLTQIMAMPIWIVRSAPFIALRRRSPLALRVLLCLWAHGRGVGSRCFPGERRLAALCKTSVPSISQAIRLLELGQWIVVERQRARGQGNRYTLRLPDDLAALHARADAWLARPATGQDAPPVGDVLQQGDLWGRAGKGRRRARHARIEAAAMNSDAWDALWRENALAGHLWLLLQAYGPSNEQTSLTRLARELGAQPSAVSAALRLLRRQNLLTASVTGPFGARHTVAAPAPDAVLRLEGATARPGRGRHRRTCGRDTGGRWLSQGGQRQKRTLSAHAARVRTPAAPPAPAPSPVQVPQRECSKHGMQPFSGGADCIPYLAEMLKYGTMLECGCSWTPPHQPQTGSGRYRTT